MRPRCATAASTRSRPGPALALTAAVHPRPLHLGRQVTQQLCCTASAHGLGATSVSATRKLSASSQGCKSTAAPACRIPPITLTRALTLALTLALALALALALTPTLARRPLSLAGRATGAEPLRDTRGAYRLRPRWRVCTALTGTVSGAQLPLDTLLLPRWRCLWHRRKRGCHCI